MFSIIKLPKTDNTSVTKSAKISAMVRAIESSRITINERVSSKLKAVLAASIKAFTPFEAVHMVPIIPKVRRPP